jgi:hemerythrin-like domain-containing protein
MNDLCIRHLQREHRELERGLTALEQFLADQARLASWGENERDDFRWMKEMFDGRLGRHMSKEEAIFFPALESFLPADLGPLAVLRGEHDDVREVFRRLQTAARARSQETGELDALAKLQHYGAGLVRLVRDHFYKEDRILFPMAGRFLTPARDAHLLQQMEAMDLTRDTGATAPADQKLAP